MSRGRSAWLLALLALAVYLAPLRNVGSADTFPATFLPLSLLGDGNLDFNEFVCPVDPSTGRAIAYEPQRCLAPLPYYFGLHEGRVVSTYPIVAGLVNLPVHLVASALGVDGATWRFQLALITAALTTAAAVGVLMLVLAQLGFRQRTVLLTGLTFAFGTLAWSSSAVTLWQHGPSLLWLSIALLGLLKESRRGLVYAGLFLGLAVWTRPTNVLIALPLALYALRRHPEHRLAMSAAAAVPLALMAVYSQLMLGSVTALGQGQQMRVGAEPWLALVGVLLSPGRGLFVYSPILLLGLLALPRAWRDAAPHPLVRPLLLGTAGVIGVHALWAIWWGGHSFGYRLLTEALPTLLILTAAAWEWFVDGRRLRMVGAAALLLWSVAANALGALVAPCGFDTEPDYLDNNPARLWSLRDTELERCARRVLDGPERR